MLKPNRNLSFVFSFIAVTFAVTALTVAHPLLSTVPDHTDFPPIFHGDRFAYFLALVGLMSVSVLASNVFLENLQVINHPGSGAKTPMKMNAQIEACWMLVMIFGITPDTVILLGWGEASMARLAIFDRAFDFLCTVPFTYGWVLRARCRSVIDFQLTKEPLPTDIWPSWGMVRHKVYMLGLVVLLSLGVALAK